MDWVCFCSAYQWTIVHANPNAFVFQHQEQAEKASDAYC